MDNKRQANLCRQLLWLPHIVFIILLALTLTSTQVRAQSTQGSIGGTVKDTAGAVVPGAIVTLTNIDEGTTRTAKTDGVGDYHFQDVKAAHYSLVATATGFEKWTVKGVVLNVRQQLHLDVTLAVGSVQQEVLVTGESVSSIETDTPTISGTYTSDDANGLPVNTRASSSGTSAASILGTMPGVQDDSSGISLQGALPFQTEVTVDGITVKDTAWAGYLGDAFPSTESISEIRADGVLNNAEYGDPAQIIVTTKGGSNKLHGSAFWYYQSSAFDAIAYTYPTTTTKPSFHGNTFGASAGGPVVIPHFYNGHNRSFFYGGYEGWRYPAKETVMEKVPSTLMKSGDFSKYTSTGFTGLSNPFTGGSYGTLIPLGSLNTISTSTLKAFYPDPNIGDATAYTDNSVANWQENMDASSHSNQFDVRGDQYFGSNQKFLLWGRYTWKNFPTTSPLVLNLPSSTDSQKSRVLKVDTNWTITPSLINEGSFGLTHYINGGNNSFDGKAWTNAQNWSGLQNLWYNALPEMDFNNMQGLTADRMDSHTTSNTYDYNDVLIWTKGRHTMKFGVNIQHLEAVMSLSFYGANNYGTYAFNTSGSTGMFTGVDFGDFLLGLPNVTDYAVVQGDNDGFSNHFHAFAQDEWRISPQLTLSYGLRYELHPGYNDKNGYIGNFDPSVALSGRVIYPSGHSSLLATSYLASANACDPDGVNNTNSSTINGATCMPVVDSDTAGYPSGLKKYPHLRFMPRVGFAYRPTAGDKWVVRAGMGLYNINMLGSNFYSLTGTVQSETATYQNSLNTTTHTPGFQWPSVYAGSGSTGGSANYGQDYFGTANSVDWKDPYTEQWSLSIDHDLGSGYAVRASYIGSETHQLVWAPDENTLPYSSTVSANNAQITSRRFPNWGRINDRATGANESYNSFQFEASHRLQRGLEFHSGFTWAKALDDNAGGGSGSFASENGGGSTYIFDRHIDFGNVYGTRRLRWQTTALYDLPFGRGKMLGSGMSRAADMAVGGWRLSSIFTLQSGPYETPYFPSGEGDPSGTGSGLGWSNAGYALSGRTQHPDQVQGVSRTPTNKSRYNWTNAKAFACPGDSSWTPGTSCTTGSGSGSVPLPIGRFGNGGTGTIEGPGLVNLSMGLSKSITIIEGMRLRLEGTFTNVLNHTNLGDPNMDLSSSTYGLITGAISSDLGGARTGQVSARFEF
jgi:hypothetical protein